MAKSRTQLGTVDRPALGAVKGEQMSDADRGQVHAGAFYPDPARGLAEIARVARGGAVAVWDSIERSDGYTALQELFRDELGADAASSLDAPFAMGKPGVLEAFFGAAGVAEVSYRSIEGVASTRSTSGSPQRFGDGRSAPRSATGDSQTSSTWLGTASTGSTQLTAASLASPPRSRPGSDARPGEPQPEPR